MNLGETIRDELSLARGTLSNENRKETSQVLHRKDFRLMSETNGQVVSEQGSVISSQTEVELYIKDLERQLASVEDESRLENLIFAKNTTKAVKGPPYRWNRLNPHGNSVCTYELISPKNLPAYWATLNSARRFFAQALSL